MRRNNFHKSFIDKHLETILRVAKQVGSALAKFPRNRSDEFDLETSTKKEETKYV